MKTRLPFHEWKSQQIAKDSKERGVFKHYRPYEWYHKAYGGYCNSFERKEVTLDR